MRSAGQSTVSYSSDLLQFFHQVFLGVKSAGSVYYDRIGSASYGGLYGIIRHRCGVGAIFVFDEVQSPDALTLYLQLVHSRRAERISGREDNFLAITPEPGGQLRNGRSFARTVHT